MMYENKKQTNKQTKQAVSVTTSLRQQNFVLPITEAYLNNAPVRRSNNWATASPQLALL